jgi:hypothetical protein
MSLLQINTVPISRCQHPSEGRALPLLALKISQAKLDMASKRPKGEAVSMIRCARWSGLEAVRHGEEEHRFGTKREARGCTSGRRPR